MPSYGALAIPENLDGAPNLQGGKCKRVRGRRGRTCHRRPSPGRPNRHTTRKTLHMGPERHGSLLRNIETWKHARALNNATTNREWAKRHRANLRWATSISPTSFRITRETPKNDYATIRLRVVGASREFEAPKRRQWRYRRPGNQALQEIRQGEPEAGYIG